MERILSYGTLIAAATVVLSLASTAHAGNTASGVKESAGNYAGGCRGPSCSVRGPTPTTNQKRCITVGPKPGQGGHPYTRC